MFATLTLGPLLLAQAATAVMVEQQYEVLDVAYGELAGGDPAAALVELEAELQANPGDPAVLINLGTAHSLLGNYERAEFYYRAARETSVAYEMELAGGRWLDSRDVARLALASVELEALASR